MTLPASFPISIQQINVELGRLAGDPFSMIGAAERGLAGIASGPISMSDFLGKSRFSIDYMAGVTDTTAVVNYGDDVPTRRIWILACGGDSDNGNNYTITGTISGAAATAVVTHSGDAGAVISATAILVGQPTGTSGTITIGGGGGHTLGFYVIRTTGYSSVPTFADNNAGLGASPWSVNVPANGLTLGVACNHNSIAVPIWSGITHRSTDGANIGNNHHTGLGYDFQMAADGAKSIRFTPASVTVGVSSGCVASFAPL